MNQKLALENYGMMPMSSTEMEENSGGWLILLAWAIEAAALAIEVGSVAVAGDMILNPSKYTDAYKKGAAGR